METEKKREGKTDMPAMMDVYKKLGALGAPKKADHLLQCDGGYRVASSLYRKVTFFRLIVIM